MCKLLRYEINSAETLLFYGNELNTRHDFQIMTNGSLKNVDTLLFFDSRGVSREFDDSIVDLIIRKISSNRVFLLVSRPLEITTWMTLFNFLQLNEIAPKTIITNMGFVDFTPKKMSIIEKSICQYDYFFSKNDAEITFLEKYKSQNEGELSLFQQAYPSKFISLLQKLLSSSHNIILNTPSLISEYFFERKRPKSFFEAVLKSNEFNRSLQNQNIVLEFHDFDNSETYDGVHYTEKGNRRIFSQIQVHLE
jgi:hypothetical protein